MQANLDHARRLGDEGDWSAMADHLRAGLEDLGDDPLLLCWLGVAERELGLEGVAYERFKQCLALEPDDPHVLATAGNALAMFDDPQAEAALRTAALLAPAVALTRWLYGAYLTREGFLTEGLNELQAAREIEPDNAEITYELGVGLALQGNHEGAADEFFRAVELGDDEGWTRIVLGLALVEDGRVDEAVPELVEGARSRPEDVEAQLLASLAAAGEGMADLAWEMLERARQRGVGIDLATVDEVESRLEDPTGEAHVFLVKEVAPGAYRTRLQQRP